MRLILRGLIGLVLAGLNVAAPASAGMPGLPSWYRFNATLSEAPRVGVPVVVQATVTSLLGDLEGIKVSLLTPPGWSQATQAALLDRLASGASTCFTFSLTPGAPMPNGSIGCKLSVKTPKSALIEQAGRLFPQEVNKIKSALSGWPDVHETFTDMPFALYPEEGFYPLESDMWLTYDDRLKPEGFTRGPALYRDGMITPFQAQTDVEMYDRLQGLIKSDPKLASTLEGQGIDLKKKKFDQLLGLYVLAVEAYLKGDQPNAESLLNRFVTESRDAAAVPVELVTAAENLRGLAAWASGDRRTAEQALQRAFYRNRKLPIQRYILRNIGLLMVARGDRATAREMLRLASEMKPAYVLAVDEYRRLKER